MESEDRKNFLEFALYIFLFLGVGCLVLAFYRFKTEPAASAIYTVGATVVFGVIMQIFFRK